jgi:hypothetical protein
MEGAQTVPPHRETTGSLMIDVAIRQATIRLDPNRAYDHNNPGAAYGAQGFQSRAKGEYKAAVDLGSTYLPAYGNLGYSEYRKLRSY